MQKKFTLFCAAVIFSYCCTAQWTIINESNLKIIPAKRVIKPQQYKVFAVTKTALTAALQKAPQEFQPNTRNANNILLVPMPDGSLQRFSIYQSAIMEPGLQQKYPEIKTYSGQGIDDPYASIRIDWNPYSGFHGRILSPNGDVYIDPLMQHNTDIYQSYYQRDFKTDKQFNELPLRYVPGRSKATSTFRTNAAAPCRGTQLFTYRAAVSCTGEYAQAVTGSATPTKAATLAAIVTSINRVTQVYERDLSIRLILIANNDVIVYTDPATDPYDGNNDGGTLLEESKDTIPVKIGNANFDIGHTFSTGGGGVAYLGVVCDNDYKAGGVTGSSNPVGDPYDIDYVAHEMGHQFGGNHTFRGANGSCAGNGNFGPPFGSFSGYEPGSGTTIQAYAGICLTDDMQPNSDPFFHSVSYDEMVNYVTSGFGGSCKGVINTGNNVPVITAMNFNGASIPVGTPFTLSATATDADGDALTYGWEQWDVALAPATYNPANGYPDGNAIWRSRVPTTNGKRTIPDIRYVAANYMPAAPPSQMNGLRGEVLPTVLKNYSFRLTVRDNKAGGGGVATGGGKPVDPATDAGGLGCSFNTAFSINVVPGTFAVTSPNGGETYNGNTVQTITWLNTGTNVAPINCQVVKITLSTDGGLTYPITVLNSTPNDGSQQVVIPNVSPTTSTARIRVEAADNIFFDISNANFTIQNVNAPLPVLLKDFTVKQQAKNNAVLQWQTAQEQDNKGFEIERSVGSENDFRVVDFVAGKGNTATGNQYSFVHENQPLNTNIYYRLRQADQTGRITTSATKMIRFNSKGNAFTLLPNPARDYFNISNKGEQVVRADVQIFDAAGRLVKKIGTALQQNTRIDISALSKGYYTVRITADGQELLSTKLLVE